MSNQERAAQFAPFAALTGLDAAVEETARLTEQPVELTEERPAGPGRNVAGRPCGTRKRRSKFAISGRMNGKAAGPM